MRRFARAVSLAGIAAVSGSSLPGCLFFDIGINAGEIDPGPVENVIGTAAPLAYAATLAMAALEGSPIPCASTTAGCSTYPCEVEIDVHVGDGCVLPIGQVGATGRVPVTAIFSTPDDAEIVALFHDLDVDGERVVLRRGACTVSRDGDELLVAYGHQGLEATEDQVRVDQAAWVVTVDTAGTLGDTSDDRLEIDGTQQIVIDSSVTQVAVTRAVLSPGCRRNPTAGTATITSISDEAGGVITLRFHSACDGRASVPASVGSNFGSLGGSVPLDLFR